MLSGKSRTGLFVRKDILGEESASAGTQPCAVQRQSEKFGPVEFGVSRLASDLCPNEEVMPVVKVFGFLGRLAAVKLRRRYAEPFR